MEENKIVIYQTEDGQTQIDVRLEDETVWLTQAQMSELFQTDRTSIVRHISNIYKVDELDRESTCVKIAQVQTEGKREFRSHHSVRRGDWCSCGGCFVDLRDKKRRLLKRKCDYGRVERK